MTQGCGDVSTEGACDGTTQLTCDSLGELIAIDCSEQGSLDLGGTCLTPAGHSSQCGFATCTQGSPAECDGNVEIDCNAGVTSRLTCPPGSSCVPGQGCTGDGPPCTSDRCDGDDEVSCTNGREWRIHCADEPIVSTCIIDPGKPGSPSSASCRPSPLLECDPLSYMQSCDGTLLRYCDGEPRAIDCAVLGFSTCDATGKVALCK